MTAEKRLPPHEIVASTGRVLTIKMLAADYLEGGGSGDVAPRKNVSLEAAAKRDRKPGVFAAIGVAVGPTTGPAQAGQCQQHDCQGFRRAFKAGLREGFVAGEARARGRLQYAQPAPESWVWTWLAWALLAFVLVVTWSLLAGVLP